MELCKKWTNIIIIIIIIISDSDTFKFEFKLHFLLLYYVLYFSFVCEIYDFMTLNSLGFKLSFKWKNLRKNNDSFVGFAHVSHPHWGQDLWGRGHEGLLLYFKFENNCNRWLVEITVSPDSH